MSLRHLVIPVLLLTVTSAVRAKDTIQIGADFGLSGSVAEYGQWAQRGVGIAIEQVNAESERKLDVIYEDNQGDTARAVSGYHKLRDQDKAQAVLTYLSNIALAISPLANRDHIVQMDVSANAPSYSTPDDYTYRTGVIATDLVSFLAEVLKNRFHISEIGILYIDNAQGEEMASAFEKFYSGKVKARISFKPGAGDFRAEILKLRGQKIADIFLIGHLSEAGQVVRQARAAGFEGRFFSTVYSVEGHEFVDAAQEAADGVLYVAPVFSSESDFARKYRERFNEPANYFAAQAGLVRTFVGIDD